MEKLTAFNLYAKNEHGGWQPSDIHGGLCHVYRADDVERVLAQIRNGCVDDGDEGNALFRLSPGEIRKLISDALGSTG